VAVVGAGIAGLAAAWELSGGAAGPGPDSPDVVLLEAGSRPGGRLEAGPLEGRLVDWAADGFLARRPEATELCREVGLEGSLRPVGAQGASVFARGRPRPLPPGLVLGVPTRWRPLARSGVLGARGSLRALRDVVAPRPDVRRPLGDRAVGPMVAHKLGQRVVDVLVDPMLGGIHAGAVADMSAAATFPLLLAVAQRRGGFMRSLRGALRRGGSPGLGLPAAGTASPSPAPDGPAFYALEGGMPALVEALRSALEARGVRLRTGCPVQTLGREGPAPWTVHTGGAPVPADAVVLALPAGPAADLLAPHDAEASTLLRGIEYASVAVVSLAYPPDAVPPDLYGTGLLVPRGTALPGLEGPARVTAVTYLSRKWPHLADDGRVLLRASVGRAGEEEALALGDDDLVARVTEELGLLVGTTGAPRAAAVHRAGAALPQYKVHHLLRVAGIEAAVRRLPPLAVAGAAYRGVGIPACVASGRAAAVTVRQALAEVVTGGAGPGAQPDR
jgi:oxygen-dependent protoporphyrinogen oxidase